MHNCGSGHLAALFTILIWGTTFIATKILLTALTPVEILFLRFALGLAALWLARPQRLRTQNAGQELTLAAAVILREPFTVTTAAGTALAMAGLFISNYKS